MPRDSELGVVLVYPDLLGTYGDRGNALALTYRAQGRDLPVRLIEVAPDEHAPESADLYLVGGGEDVSQALAWETLKAEKNIIRALQGGAPCLAVCAGFQLLSREFRDRDGAMVAGLGLLDVRCGRLSGERAVGEVVAEPVGIPGLPTLSGYENHQGDATLGPDARPLGRVVRGRGNGDGSTEGTVQGNVVATYLHGPVLVRNPALADHLLERVVGEPLAPMPDDAVERLRRERIGAALTEGLNPGILHKTGALWGRMAKARGASSRGRTNSSSSVGGTTQ